MDRQGVPTGELMTSDIISATPETTVDEAVDTLLTENIGSLVVMDGEGNLVGVVTANDFMALLGESDHDGDTPVSDIMTEDVVTIDPDADIQTAAARMITNSISHLPVEDDDGLVGMLSTTDITAYSVSRA